MAGVDDTENSGVPFSPAAGTVQQIELQNLGQHTDESYFPNEFEKTPEPRCKECKKQWWIFRYYIRRYLVQSSIFENFILLAILSNCGFLAVDTPSLEDEDPKLRRIVDDAEYVYFVIFFLEMLFKQIAYGLHRPSKDVNDERYIEDETDQYVGYFNDGWSIIDFVIVCTSFTIFTSSTNVSSIRVLRVLKPLRTISRVKGLKVLVETLLQSFSKLLDVCILIMFLFVVFGIVAIQSFSGALRRRCVSDDYWQTYIIDQGNDFDWIAYSDDSNFYGADASLETYCKSEGEVAGCDGLDFVDEETEVLYSYKCREGADGPFSGMLNFDNIFTAIFTQFVLVTLEGWADLMYTYQDAHSDFVSLYFFLLTFVCAIFALNLTLAVMVNTFSTVNEEEEREGDKEKDPDALYDLAESESESEELSDEFEQQAKETLTQEQTELIKVTDTFRVETNRKKTNDESKTYSILADEAMKAVKAEKSFLMESGNPIVLFCNRLSLSENFGWFVLIVIMANTVVLAIEWPGMSKQLEDDLERINLGFSIFFIVEMVVKLLGLGWEGYISDSFNMFDGVIVVISIIELSLSSSSGGLSSLRALRMFRVLRVLRILGKIPGLRILMGALANAAGDVAYLLIIPLIFIFMFGTLGISLYADKWKDDQDSAPREKFDNIVNAMIVVFRCMTGDDWNEVMFSYTEAFEDDGYMKWVVGLYFISIIIFGNFIFLNLFIAVLLSRMSDEHHDTKKITKQDLNDRKLVCAVNKWLYEDLITYCRESMNLSESTNEAEARVELIGYCEHVRKVRNRNKKLISWKKNRNRQRMAGTSIGFLDIRNSFRQLVWRIVHAHYFEWAIDTLIIVNCLLLMIETPPTPSDPYVTSSSFFVVCDYFFTIIFVLEMVLKIIADGCFSAPIFAERSWKTLYRFDRDTETDDEYEEYNIEEEVRKWHRRCLLNLMELQVYQPGIKIGDAEDGMILSLIESTDDWVLVDYEASKYQQEFRLLFKSGRDESEYAETIYQLREDTGGSDAQKGEWSPVEDKPDLIDVDPTLVNVMVSPDLTDYRLNAYLADGWNQIDAFVVIVALVSILFPEYQGLRALRAVRPLRLAIRFEEIRTVLEAIIGAIPGVFYTMVFCLLFWMVLAILGTNLFSGKFGYCSWGAAEEKATCTELDACNAWYNDPLSDDYYNSTASSIICRTVGPNITDPCGSNYNMTTCMTIDEEDGFLVDIDFIIPPFNFDNVFNSIQTIYIIATMDEWTQIMYDGMDVAGEFKSFQKEESYWNFVFFILVVIVGGFFSFNLIISVVVDNFNRIKDEKNGAIFITEQQRQWREKKKLLDRVQLQKRYPQPENKWRKYCFLVAMNPYFDPLIIGCICLNALTMSMTHYGMSDGTKSFIDACDLTFIVVFTMEAFLKIMAIGFPAYWMENWNRFDFIIVIASLIGKAFPSGPGLSVARVFRIGRVLRLINKAETLRTLFLTLVYSIPSLWNIGLLLFVIFFVYAVIGMNIFGAIEPNSMGSNGITDRANFQTFGSSFSLLYRIGTYDAWGPLYLSCKQSSPDCQGPTCGNSFQAGMFFITFGVIGSLVMINLFIAVILDTFDDSLESQKKEKDLKSVFIWSEIWSQVDTNCDKMLDAGDFVHTLIRAPKPAGLSEYQDTVRVLKATRSLSARVMKFKEMRDEVSKQMNLNDEDEVSANNFPSFPSQEEIKAYLKDLNLLVRRGNYEGKETWIVKYREAVWAIGTKIDKFKLLIHQSEIDEDKVPIYNWYCDVFAIEDTDQVAE